MWYSGLHTTTGFFTVFGGNAHTLWDTTEDEDPLGRQAVMFRPYILHGAYWYESEHFRVIWRNSIPCRPLILP
jgi:hypothetical protein